MNYGRSPSIMDISLNPRQKFKMEIPKDNNLFVYVIQGDGQFGEEEISVNSKTVAIFDQVGKLAVHTGDEGVRFVLFVGKPLNEPIAWGGPIVMNSEKELAETFEELNNGEFIKQSTK
ncbi:pirin-like C-terminal cupin domain-containing protein [Methanobrevibacter filiformis]|uniref:Pirin C-terminal domain-containing protein n=1 Tax=Methanobrevibacter filiformis TaxID=55758 RepID=A0A165Z6S2_9EURY|nr:pirin-like C-terminal cupin domain-containing protein [Methanobrevibacter filiformis]KZX10318.1 hypothetical protein MBFIL_18160 [Methanobrevibacter filiformis]